MKDKEKLSMYVDITRITIILCWIALIAFWCLKLFGGNWFEIMVENENFIKFSDMVQNTWLKYLVSFITIGIANYLLIGAICQKFYFKGTQLWVVIFAIVSMWAVSNFVPLSFFYFPSWYGYIAMLGISIYYQKGFKKLYGVFAIIFETIFTVISFLIRNLPIVVLDNYLIASILMIDVYIMIALYYLYSNLNKEANMILLGHGLLSKEEAQQRGYSSWKRFWHNVGYGLSFRWAKKTK